MVCVNVCVGEVKGQDVRYISFMGTFYVGARSPVVGLTNFSWRFMLVHCICYLTSITSLARYSKTISKTLFGRGKADRRCF